MDNDRPNGLIPKIVETFLGGQLSIILIIIAASLVALAIVVATTVLRTSPVVEEEEAPVAEPALVELA